MQSLVRVLNSAHAQPGPGYPSVLVSLDSGEDAVPPDTAEKRHSLPLQACRDRLTVKATPARPGCGKPYASAYFCPRLYLEGYVVAEADGGEGDEAVVEGLEVAPPLVVGEHGGARRGDDGRQEERRRHQVYLGNLQQTKSGSVRNKRRPAQTSNVLYKSRSRYFRSLPTLQSVRYPIIR